MDRSDTVAVILAGGLGTRVRALYPELPKPFIPVAGKPFIEWVIGHWASHGVRRFVVSLGHLAEVGEAYFAGRPADGVSILTVREERPLGTGGAALQALRAVPDAGLALVLNGDSLLLADPAPLWETLHDSALDCALLAVKVEDTSRYGSLDLDAEGRVLRLREKQAGAGIINAGAYLFRRRVFDRFPGREPLSMETDVFPNLIAAGVRIQACLADGPFLDIGTPEDLVRAAEFL